MKYEFMKSSHIVLPFQSFCSYLQLGCVATSAVGEVSNQVQPKLTPLGYHWTSVLGPMLGAQLLVLKLARSGAAVWPWIRLQ